MNHKPVLVKLYAIKIRLANRTELYTIYKLLIPLVHLILLILLFKMPLDFAKTDLSIIDTDMAKTSQNEDHITAVKIVISLLILSLAVALFFFYQVNALDILSSGKYYTYLFTAFVALGLLLGLTYLVHQPHHPHGGKKKKK